MNHISSESFTLNNPPIIEAVVDIDCDLPVTLDHNEVEQVAKESLQDVYPKVHHQIRHEQSVPPQDGQKLTIGFRQNLHSIQFRSEDEKQLVQFRRAGYSFNRLSPYEGLDTYLPEIQRTWSVFSEIVRPLKISKVGLRTINRILLPLRQGSLRLEEYLTTAPKLPDCHNLTFTGFLNQHMAIEPSTNHRVNILTSTQTPYNESVPLIVDIDVFSPQTTNSLQWEAIHSVIAQLRTLKNNVFKSMLTEKCLDLFSQHQS